MTRDVLVPVPTFAVPVQVALDTEDRLDLLSETVLHLMENGPQSVHDIVEKLEISADIVQSAVNLLLDEQLCKLVDGSQEVFVATKASGSGVAGRVLEKAWAFFSPHTAGLLPLVWLDRDLPKDEDALRDHEQGYKRCEVLCPTGDIVPSRSWLKSIDLDWELRVLAGRPDLRVEPVRQNEYEDDEEGNGDGEVYDEERSLPDLPAIRREERGPLRVRSILRDEARESLGGPWQKTRVWSKVRYVPRVSGRPTVVFHSPGIVVGDESERVEDRLAVWVKANVPAVAAAVDRLGEEMFAESSVVLRNSRIRTEADLEQQLAEYRAETGWDISALESVMPQVAKRLDNAQRHLVLYRVDPRSYLDACSGYEHVIEQVGIELRGQARGHVVGWWDSVQKRPRPQHAEIIDSRCGDNVTRNAFARLGLLDAVAPSLPHVSRCVGDPDRTRNTVRQVLSDACGFGESITLWLLPLVLCDDASVQSHARLVKNAVARTPGLFQDLDRLRVLRDTFAHHRERRQQPVIDLEHVDTVCRRVCDSLVVTWAP
jgi:hypothetical protein